MILHWASWITITPQAHTVWTSRGALHLNCGTLKQPGKWTHHLHLIRWIKPSSCIIHVPIMHSAAVHFLLLSSQSAKVGLTECEDVRNYSKIDEGLNWCLPNEEEKKGEIERERKKQQQQKKKPGEDVFFSLSDSFQGSRQLACLPKLLTVRGLVGNNAIFNLW